MAVMAIDGPSPHSHSLRLGLPAPKLSKRHHAQSLLGPSFHGQERIMFSNPTPSKPRLSTVTSSYTMIMLLGERSRGTVLDNFLFCVMRSETKHSDLCVHTRTHVCVCVRICVCMYVSTLPRTWPNEEQTDRVEVQADGHTPTSMPIPTTASPIGHKDHAFLPPPSLLHTHTHTHSQTHTHTQPHNHANMQSYFL